MDSIAVSTLVHWFQQHKRSFPWRENPSPYEVWVSEVMLQQTQAVTVIPYFSRFIEKYPTIKALAASPIEEVLKAWEGLGYYSRARNLHEGAKYVAEHFDGQLPQKAEMLKKIKGIGPYTLGAIMCFAFKQAYPAVDGNVLRVISRLFALEDDISQPKTKNKIESLVAGLLTKEEGYIFSEALIELGATVCKKQAQCLECPLKRSCQAFKYQLVSELPKKSKKITYEKRVHKVWVLMHDDHLLIKKNGEGIMQDLHEFPFDTVEVDAVPTPLSKLFSQSRPSSLPFFKQSFTRYRVTLEPYLLELKEKKAYKGYEWKSKEELEALAFSSGHKRLLEYLLQHKHF
ncbi:MAG: A/G-specific adenine glycosylase [Chlamydiales bacterium]|nr:A/G-specific adenine glycosylase [Chlamydiales bacterium]